MAESDREGATGGNGSELVTRPLAHVSGFVSVRRSVGGSGGQMGNPGGFRPPERGGSAKNCTRTVVGIMLYHCY